MITTSRPTWLRALVRIERSGKAVRGIMQRLPRENVVQHPVLHCARLRRGIGAEINRSPPLFLGIVKR